MSWAGGQKHRTLKRLVLETYGARCWLCGAPIDLTAQPRTPQAMSIDHVVPRSRGGSDELANLRPAHHGCNSRRGTRSPTTTRTSTMHPVFFQP